MPKELELSGHKKERSRKSAMPVGSAKKTVELIAPTKKMIEQLRSTPNQGKMSIENEPKVEMEIFGIKHKLFGNAAIASTIKKMEVACTEKDQEISELKEDCKSAARIMENWSKDNEKLREIIANKQAAIDTLHTLRDSLHQELETEKRRVKLCKQDIERLEKDCIESIKIQKRDGAEINRLCMELEELKKQLKGSIENCRKASESNTKLRLDLQVLNSNAKDFESKLEQLEKDKSLAAIAALLFAIFFAISLAIHFA